MPDCSSLVAIGRVSAPVPRFNTACTAVPKTLVFSTDGSVSSRRPPRPGRAAGGDFDDRAIRKQRFQLAGRPERGQTAGMDDRDPIAVLGFVEVVRLHE